MLCFSCVFLDRDARVMARGYGSDGSVAGIPFEINVRSRRISPSPVPGTEDEGVWATMRISNLRQKLLLATFASVATIAFVAGCSGSSGGNSNPTPTPTPCSTIAPQLSVIQTQIFTPTCAVGTTCHSGSSPAGPGLDLSSTTKVFATASNVQAVETFNGSNLLRLDPAGKATSYLYLKITNATGISQLPMPQTGQLLDSCSIDAIGQWIDSGMPNN